MVSKVIEFGRLSEVAEGSVVYCYIVQYRQIDTGQRGSRSNQHALIRGSYIFRVADYGLRG